MKTTISIVRAAARAWHETMRHRSYLSNDRYQNPVLGHYIDTAFVATFLGHWVEELVKL